MRYLFLFVVISTIHSLSEGIVRKIGKLVDKSLALSVSLKKDIITEEEVMAASKEL